MKPGGKTARFLGSIQGGVNHGHMTRSNEFSQGFVAVEDHDEMMRRELPLFDDILFLPEAPLGTIALIDKKTSSLINT